MSYRQHHAGFTITEVVVALAVMILFLALFLQFFLTMTTQRVALSRQALASDIAYTNLRKFTTRPTVTCDVSTMDLTTTPNASGKLLGDETATAPNSYGFTAEPAGSTAALGPDAHQTVVALAPKGCGSPAYANTPLLIRSTVTYGSDKAVHATLVN